MNPRLLSPQVKLSNATVFGKYRCRAKNEIGSTQRDILLQQGVQPKPPQHVNVASVGATIAVLDVQTPVVGPKVQQSTQSSHKSGTNASSGGSTSKSGAGANDTLGYRVRLTKTVNGTDLSFEQDCDPGKGARCATGKSNQLFCLGNADPRHFCGNNLMADPCTLSLLPLSKVDCCCCFLVVNTSNRA